MHFRRGLRFARVPLRTSPAEAAPGPMIACGRAMSVAMCGPIFPFFS